jgi:hypothetical protein
MEVLSPDAQRDSLTLYTSQPEDEGRCGNHEAICVFKEKRHTCSNVTGVSLHPLVVEGS